MKTLLKLLVLCVGIYATTSMAMTRAECLAAKGTYEGTALTGKCIEKLSAIKTPTGIKQPLTAEECLKKGGTVLNGNCETITKYITAKEAPKATQ